MSDPATTQHLLQLSQQLLETVDFATFTTSPITGPAATNKGLALFPRRIGGRFAALSRHDWSGELDVTDDFVAFAIDPELDDLEQALSASASHDRVAAWRARGWL